MIINSTISNFKGISSCDLRNIKLVNLFIGKNNACKSTILESLYYTLKEFTGSNLKEAISRRTNPNVRAGVYDLWYGYNSKNPIKISIGFKDTNLSMEVSWDAINQLINTRLAATDCISGKTVVSPETSRYFLDLGIAYSFRFGFNIFVGLPDNIRDMANSYTSESQFLDSYTKRDTTSTEEILNAIKQVGKAKEFGRSLQHIYGIGEVWEFLQSQFTKEFHAATIVNDKPFYLSGLGDGLRFTIQILGRVLLAHNTAMFIEEIEDSQYYGSLKKLIPCLVAISRENNVQLFITTHSYFVWDLLEKEFDETGREKDFSVFHVKRNLKNGITDCTAKTKEQADKFWNDVHQDMDEDL